MKRQLKILFYLYSFSMMYILKAKKANMTSGFRMLQVLSQFKSTWIQKQWSFIWLMVSLLVSIYLEQEWMKLLSDRMNITGQVGKPQDFQQDRNKGMLQSWTYCGRWTHEAHVDSMWLPLPVEIIIHKKLPEIHMDFLWICCIVTVIQHDNRQLRSLKGGDFTWGHEDSVAHTEQHIHDTWPIFALEQACSLVNVSFWQISRNYFTTTLEQEQTSIFKSMSRALNGM